MNCPRLLGLAIALVATGADAVTTATPSDALRAYLRRALGPAFAAPDVRAAIAWRDLNGDGRPEALVYISGTGRCGSGGCNLQIFEQTRDGFRARGNLTITRPPIGVLASRTHGWRDLSVSVSGGGIGPGYIAAVPFRGEGYASNPTVPPARRAPAGVALEIVIPEGGQGELLFDSASP